MALLGEAPVVRPALTVTLKGAVPWPAPDERADMRDLIVICAVVGTAVLTLIGAAIGFAIVIGIVTPMTKAANYSAQSTYHEMALRQD